MGWIETKLESVASAVVVEGERTRSELAATFTESLRGARIDGALSRPVRANAVQFGSAGRLLGWSLRAVTADVTVTFHDGRNAEDDPVATVVIPAGTSSTICTPGAGVSFVGELFTEVSTAGGTVTGAVWIGAVD